MREFKKEIGAEVKIVNSETSHFIYNGQVDEMNMNARNNKPLFVYKEEKLKKTGAGSTIFIRFDRCGKI